MEARPVTVAITQGNIAAVSSGLNPGDVVVTDGQDKLQTGSTIEPRSGSAGNSASDGKDAAAGTPGS